MIEVLANRASVRQAARTISAQAVTTPGRLWTLSVSVALVAALLWMAGSTALEGTRSSVDTIGRDEAPAIIDAQQIHEALADADRSAANAYLMGDVQSSQQRQQYERDIATGTFALEQAAEHNDTGGRVSQDLQEIIAMLTQYTGLVETARANNRQGFTVGVAYLRAASELMHNPRTGILAKVDGIADLESDDLADRNATLVFDAVMLALFFALDLALLAVLLGTQWFVRRRFHRDYSLRLVAATALLLLLTGWVIVRSADTYQGLSRAQQQAFPRLHALWQIRALVDDADGAESLALIAPSNADTFDIAFRADTARLADRPLTDQLLDQASRGRIEFRGLLADEAVAAKDPGERATVMKALRAYQQFLEADAAVRARSGSDHQVAVGLALGTSPGQLAAAFADLDAALEQAIASAQREFDASIAAAEPGSGLGLGIPLAAIVIAVLAIWALQPRLAEYRG